MRLKRYIEPLIHLIIWIAGFLLFVSIVKTLGSFKRVDGTLLWPVITGTIINLALFYLPALVLIPRLSKKKKAGRFLLLTVGWLILLTSIETLIDFSFFVYYYSDFKEPFHSQMITNAILNFIVLTVSLGYGFTKNWLVGEKLRKAMKQEMTSAQLNFLKTQLNPHFLFNVLNMAFSSANSHGDEKTADIIEKLSGLMRYMLYESNVDKVDLEKEIQYIHNYLELQKMRFSSEMPVQVVFTIEGDYSGLRIAPLILITFIENAFKFGTKLEQESNIRITMLADQGELVFGIQNPIFKVRNDLERQNSGIGLENVRKRLEMIYPGKHHLHIENDGSLYTVKLSLKLNT